MNDGSLTIATTALPSAYARGEAAGARGHPARAPMAAGKEASRAPSPPPDTPDAEAAGDLDARAVKAAEEAEKTGKSAPDPSVGPSDEEQPPVYLPLSIGELEKVVESINHFLQSSQRALEFSVDDSSGKTIIKVMDAEKEKLIRQIPPESALALIEHFRDGQGIAATGLVVEKA